MGQRKGGESSPVVRASAPPLARQRSWRNGRASNEDLLEVLRTSLAASTPRFGEYRSPPPSSTASSCGQVEQDDVFIVADDEDRDAPTPPGRATEWEGWINWDEVEGMSLDL